MRPYPDEVLRALQTGVVTHFAPELKTSYGQAQFGFSMLLFGIVQRDYDTAVPDLLEANAELRSMLADADAALAAIDRDDARAARAAIAALPAATTSLRLSALRAEHDALRAAIGGMASLIEPAADDAALMALRDVRTRMYDWLAADARKRIVPILSAG